MSINDKPSGPGEPVQWDDDKPTQVGRPAFLDGQAGSQPNQTAPFQSSAAMTPPIPAAPVAPVAPVVPATPAVGASGATAVGVSGSTEIPMASAIIPAPDVPAAPVSTATKNDTTPGSVPVLSRIGDDEDDDWVEEGLFFQGATPPPSDEWNDRDWIQIPHEHYIPVSKSRLLGALWKFQKAEAAGDHFKHFIELTEAIYHFHYHQTLNELKEDYEYFAPDGGAELRAGVSVDELIEREQRFIANFVKTMSGGNFIPFSDEDRKRSKEQNYLFDLAIDVQWDVYDKKMIEDFLDKVDSPEGEHLREILELDEPIRDYLKIPEEFDNGVMLFYRGIGRDQASGMFVMQKIDLFLGRFLGMIVWPFQWAIDKLRGHKEEGGELSQGFADMKKGIKDVTKLVGLEEVGKKVGLVDESKEDIAPPQVMGDAVEDEDRGVIFEPRWIRRVNLGNQKLKAADLTKVSHLQEPALSRVLCLFRLKPPMPPKILDKIPLLKKLVEKVIGKKEQLERDWTMYLKMFKDIPLADSDIVFPEKKVRMKSFDLTMLLLTSLIGIIVIAKKGFANPLILAAVASYGVKLFMGFRRARTKYMSRMTSELYHKSLDNDLGVLQYLVDSLEEQEVKEASLAYFFLWNEGRPMTEEELDGRIEAFLHENFDGLEVDFEVDDALDKVIEKKGLQPHKHLPIVKVLEGAGPNGEDLYEAVALEEALRIMDHKWDNFYEYN